MAHFIMDGVEDLSEQLWNLGVALDETAFEMVEEAAKIMDKELREEVQKRTKKYGTGVLAQSLHHHMPSKNYLGYFTVTTAKGKDTKKGKYKKKSHEAYNKKTGEYVGHRKSYEGAAVRNHDKLYYLEYGNSRQAPRPFIEKCVRRTEPKVLAKMQEVFERKAGIK